jgi:hypothetical protein
LKDEKADWLSSLQLLHSGNPIVVISSGLCRFKATEWNEL